MRGILLVLIALLMTASLTEAATITITTTPEQDAAFVAKQKALNKDRNVKLTLAEARDYLIAQWLDSLVAQTNEETKATVREAYQQAPQATKDQVKTLLGVQ